MPPLYNNNSTDNNIPPSPRRFSPDNSTNNNNQRNVNFSQKENESLISRARQEVVDSYDQFLSNTNNPASSSSNDRSIGRNDINNAVNFGSTNGNSSKKSSNRNASHSNSRTRSGPKRNNNNNNSQSAKSLSINAPFVTGANHNFNQKTCQAQSARDLLADTGGMGNSNSINNNNSQHSPLSNFNLPRAPSPVEDGIQMVNNFSPNSNYAAAIVQEQVRQLDERARHLNASLDDRIRQQRENIRHMQLSNEEREMFMKRELETSLMANSSANDSYLDGYSKNSPRNNDQRNTNQMQTRLMAENILLNQQLENDRVNGLAGNDTVINDNSSRRKGRSQSPRSSPKNYINNVSQQPPPQLHSFSPRPGQHAALSEPENTENVSHPPHPNRAFVKISDIPRADMGSNNNSQATRALLDSSQSKQNANGTITTKKTTIASTRRYSPGKPNQLVFGKEAVRTGGGFRLVNRDEAKC